jgi:hypothetical protein
MYFHLKNCIFCLFPLLNITIWRALCLKIIYNGSSLESFSFPLGPIAHELIHQSNHADLEGDIENGVYVMSLVVFLDGWLQRCFLILFFFFS